MKGLITFLFISASYAISAQHIIPVLINGKYGFTTPENKIVLEAKYDSIGLFGSYKTITDKRSVPYGSYMLPNLALVYRDSGWTLINKEYQELYKPEGIKKPRVRGFPNYYSPTDENATAKEIFKIEDPSSENWGLYNSKQDTFTGLIYELETKGSPFRYGSHPKKIGKHLVAKRVDQRYDLIDTQTGLPILNGLAALMQICGDKFRYKDLQEVWFLYNARTKETREIPFKKFSKVHRAPQETRGRYVMESDRHLNCRLEFIEFISENGKRGLANMDFNIVIEPLYSKLLLYDDRIVATLKDSNNIESLHFLDMRGQKLPLDNAKTIYSLGGTYYKYSEDDKNWKLINKQGLHIDRNIYTEIKANQQYIQYKKDKTAGIFNKQFESIIEYEADEVYALIDSRCKSEFFLDCTKAYVVKQNDKCGIIDREGKLLVKMQYRYISLAHEGHFKVENQAEKVGLIDKQGKVLLPTKYDRIYADYRKDEKYYKCYLDNKEVARYDLELNKLLTDEEVKFNKKYPSKFALNSESIPGGFVLTDKIGNKVSETIYDKIIRYPVGSNVYMTVGFFYDSKTMDIYNDTGKKISEEQTTYDNIDKINHFGAQLYLKQGNAMIVTVNGNQGILKSDGKYLSAPKKGRKVYRNKFHVFVQDPDEGLRVYNLSLEEPFPFAMTYFKSRAYGKYYIIGKIIDKKIVNSKTEFISKYGIVDKQGKELLPFIYEKLYYAGKICGQILDDKGQLKSIVFDRDYSIIYEGTHPAITYVDLHKKEIGYATKDTLYTIDLEGKLKKKEGPPESKIETFYFRTVEDDILLADVNHKVIASSKKEQVYFYPGSVPKLSDNRHLVLLQNRILLIDNIGEILAELPCDKLWQPVTHEHAMVDLENNFMTPGPREYSKKLEKNYNQAKLSDEEMQNIENHLLKITHEGKTYYYDWLKLKAYKF